MSRLLWRDSRGTLSPIAPMPWPNFAFFVKSWGRAMCHWSSIP